MKQNHRIQLRQRQVRIRAKIKRLSSRLRVSVYRSNKHIYAQIIDDAKGKTIMAANDKQLKLIKKTDKKLTKSEIAKEVGKLLAEKANKHKLGKVYFDRGGHKYHGRMAALAEGLREGGLAF